MCPDGLRREREKSNFAATVHAECINSSCKSLKRVQKKKKKNASRKTLGFSVESKHSLSIISTILHDLRVLRVTELYPRNYLRPR